MGCRGGGLRWPGNEVRPGFPEDETTRGLEGAGGVPGEEELMQRPQRRGEGEHGALRTRQAF